MAWASGDLVTSSALNYRSGNEINVKDPTYGALGDGSTNDTSAIQSAANAAAGSVLFFPPGTYMVDGFESGGSARLGVYPKNNSTWWFSSGATLKLRSQDSDTYAVINIDEVHNVTLYNPQIDGSKNDITNAGEQGHGIFIVGSRATTQNIRIYGAYVTNCHGSGLAINGTDFPVKDVFVSGSVFNDNRREGVFLSQGEDIVFVGCTATNNAGTSTEQGFRVEPDPLGSGGGTRLRTIKNIQFIGCSGISNNGRNFGVGGLDNLPEPVSVLFANCSSKNAGNQGYIVEGATSQGTVTTGIISFVNCTSLKDQLSGFYIQDSDVPVMMTNCYVEDCNQNGNTNAHFGAAFSARALISNRTTGNLFMDNCRVKNTDNKTLYALATTRTGGLTNAFIGDVRARISVDSLSNKSLVFKGGTEFTHYPGIFDAQITNVPIQTLADNATPTIAGMQIVQTGGTTTITDFDDGAVGNELTVLAAHNVVIESSTSNIVLSNNTRFTMVPGEALRLKMFSAGSWTEVGRSGALKVALPAPASGTATGTTGTIALETGSGSTFLYVCTSANSWHRIALNPF